jgi:adenosylhomocysteine nucleosidase
MTVGIISAIPEEYSKLQWDSEPRTETIINKMFQFGSINGVDVVAAECGIGKVNAAMTSALLLGHFGCSSIAFSGVAGGINPKYKIGDVLIAEQLIQHDYGAIVQGQLISAIPGSFPALADSDEDTAYIMSSEMRSVLASQVGNLVHFGRVITGDTYLACTETRKMFFAQFKADAVEMEGAAIAQVCTNWHKPFVIIRVLSDLAGNDSHVDFDQFVDDSSKKAAVVLNKVLPVLDAWE